MANVAKNLPKKTVGVVFDADVAEALEAYAIKTRDKRNGMIQRVMIEHLTKNGAWPPPEAKPKKKP